MAIKIMMPPEVIDSVAGALITKQLLREIVRNSVKTEFDKHYLVVTFHKGVSESLPHMKFADLSKLLSCPMSEVHAHVAEHMVYGSARGGCKLCEQASEALKRQIQAEKDSPSRFGPVTLTVLIRERRRPRR